MKKELLRNVRPDVFQLIKDKEKYYNITKCSMECIEFICPRCGNIVKQIVYNVVSRGLSCKKCGDGISFGEKFVFNVLDQLSLNFNIHVMFPWSNKRIYDVCIYDNDNQPLYLIEIHGKQHYQGGFETYGGRSYEEEVVNDIYKKNLALKNGFSKDEYIIVDCRESTYNYIKNSILSLPFFNQYNINNICWDDCYKNAISSYSIKAQQLWNDGMNIKDIADILKINRCTVKSYLMQGVVIGSCDYSASEARRRGHSKSPIPSNPIMVACKELKCIFYSKNDAARLTGVNRGAITRVTKGKQRFAISKSDKKKLTFMDISFEESECLIRDFNYTLVGNKPEYVVIS